jgi:8-oxo-dGTP pyrophosphatase MutT (NUDIX family)
LDVLYENDGQDEFFTNWTAQYHEFTRLASTVSDVYLMTGELIIPRDAPNDLVRAAGGILTRFIAGGRVEVACIYRESRGDWTFPKGKLDDGETFEQAAIREVHEETGMSCHVVRFVGTTNYTHRKGKPKIVAYYLMAVNEGEFTPNEEVDELVWLPLEQVRDHLTWQRDQELFDLIAQLPELRAHAS